LAGGDEMVELSGTRVSEVILKIEEREKKNAGEWSS
jgi:hypothetical protein